MSSPFSRRQVFAAGLATAAGTALAMTAGSPALAHPASRGDLPEDRIGIQLYSVRDQFSALGTGPVLERLAEIGFAEIEFAGIPAGTTVTEVGRLLRSLGLTPIGNHGGMDDASLAVAEGLGLPYTGISVLTNLYGTTRDAWKRTADDLNRFGERAAAVGSRFYVHIHGPEYLRVTDAPDRYALDLLLEYTDPRYVFWEMDIYWAYFFASYVGGAGALMDPTSWVRAHRDRFPLFHVKDGRTFAEAQAGETELALMWNPLGGAGQLPFADGITDVGQGSIDFHHFLGALADVKAHHYIWERDTANDAPKGEFTSARASYLMMRHDELAANIGR